MHSLLTVSLYRCTCIPDCIMQFHRIRTSQQRLIIVPRQSGRDGVTDAKLYQCALLPAHLCCRSRVQVNRIQCIRIAKHGCCSQSKYLFNINSVNNLLPSFSIEHFVLSCSSFRPIFLLCPCSVLTGVWSAQPTTGEKPPPLCDHTFTKIDQHRAVVFGGWSGRNRCDIDDTYVLDMETWVWHFYNMNLYF